MVEGCWWCGSIIGFIEKTRRRERLRINLALGQLASARTGATRAEIVEAQVQITFAAGLPTSIGALQAARDAFAKLDEKESQHGRP